jgi:hypothetical protein
LKNPGKRGCLRRRLADHTGQIRQAEVAARMLAVRIIARLKRRFTLRFLLKISFPVESGNASAKNGFKAIQQILEEQKPEAAYFLTDNGMRTGILIMHMEDASQIPAIAEPWFLALNARIECTPVMLPGDLQKAGPAIERAVKTFG